MKHDPYIKGEKNIDLGRRLPKLESNPNISRKRFIDILVSMAAEDQENTKLGSVTIDGEFGREKWPVIIGFHAMKRFMERTFMTPDDVLGKVLDILSDPLIWPRVVENQVMYDDDANKVVSVNGDGIMATNVKFEADGIVYVFECGMSYIRLVTVWTGYTERFVSKNSAVVNIARSGAFSYNRKGDKI